MSYFERVILLVDMDCFYCQVEENLNAAIKGKPIAVVQYNAWRGGGIIAVNYPARDRGVTRHMRGNEAKEKCPEIELVKVPNVRGKADLTKYREAGKRVAEVLQTFTTLLERASVDEAYLDITEVVNSKLNQRISAENLKTTHVVGYENVKDFFDDLNNNLYEESNKKLLIGAEIAEEVRAAVFEQTGYRCSAGVAHNKILAKLVCGLHKPNQQTVLPQQNIGILYENLPVRKIKSLGGKFGHQLAEKLNIQNMGELYRFTERELAKHFDDKTTNWLYKIARGIDVEPVTSRLVSKSIGCCKKFPGRNALKNPADIKHWLGELCLEISDRLVKDKEENNRRAKQMVVSFIQDVDNKGTTTSRTHSLTSYDAEKIANDAFEVLRKNCTGNFCLKFLGINVSKFEDIKNVNNLNTLFKNMINNKTKSNQDDKKDSNEQIDSTFNETVESNINVDVTCVKAQNNLSNKNIVCDNPEFKNVNPLNTLFKNMINNKSKSKQADKKDSDEQIDNTCKESMESNINATCSKTQNTLGNKNIDCMENSEFKNDSKTINLPDEDSNDSISQEMNNKNGNSNLNPSSFFKEYLENNQNNHGNRNFNTSLSLCENMEDATGSETSNEEIINTDTLNNEASNMDPTSSTITDICPECNKSIAIEEMISHMDYHFAINLVKSESSMYKINKTEAPSSSKSLTKPKKSTKRKFNDNNCTKLTAFFKKEAIDDNRDTETCDECGKKIYIEDIPHHVDYHVAKKIHQEINSNVTPSKVKKDDESDKIKKNSVAMFF